MLDYREKLKKEKKIRSKRVGDWLANTLVPSLENNGNTSFNFEIGCGHGHWLTSYAIKKPSLNFVGIDLISKRIEKANAKVEKRNLYNVCFCKAEANEFLEFCDYELSNTFIMYPDPWPKKRHFKRRIVQSSFLELLAKKTKYDGKLFFMTDHTDYFNWASTLISDSKYWELTDSEWPHEELSYFQNILPSNQFFCASRS
jgi:tRNA (guanine-N7-)-methyltransferase